MVDEEVKALLNRLALRIVQKKQKEMKKSLREFWKYVEPSS